MQKKGIGILPGHRISYIDHLVPLCQIMEIPILVTEKWIQTLIELYYPPMEIIFANPIDYCLDSYLCDYEVFFYVDHFRKPHGMFQFAEYFTHVKARSVYCLHGNSDKGRKTFWIEELEDEDVVLIYGHYMQDFMKEKKVNKKALFCGNYRLEFYKKHADFFEKKCSFQNLKKATLLYAPTWTSSNQKSEKRFEYSSFFRVYTDIFEKLSKDFQLIVKLHPHHVFLMPNEIDDIKEKYPQINFLEDFPLIYPLLKNMDYYLGDYSSIGYDFLYFDKPLFFLETKQEGLLQTSGVQISQKDLIDFKNFLTLEKTTYFSQKRKSLYEYAFGPLKPLEQLQKEIEEACA